MKKEEANTVSESIDDKLKMIIKLQKTPDKEEVVIQPTVENEGELFNEETQTQNQNDQTCDSASNSSKNTNHRKSAQNLKKSKQNSTISEKVESRRDQTSLAETTWGENLRELQVQLDDTIHHLSTLIINSQQINPVSTEEIVPDVIQSEVNDVNQNQPSVLYLIKPPPKLVDQLITFLSEDLVKKTCEVFIYIILICRNRKYFILIYFF